VGGWELRPLEQAPTAQAKHLFPRSLRFGFENDFRSEGLQPERTLRAAGGFTILFGASGAGKTTLLDCRRGLRNRRGRLTAAERICTTRRRRTCGWAQHGYVHQDLGLFPHMTAEENVGLGCRSWGQASAEAKPRDAGSFQIAELSGRRPAEISGGDGSGWRCAGLGDGTAGASTR